MADFPLTVSDSYGDTATFDTDIHGTVFIEVPRTPLVLEPADQDGFARAVIAAFWQAERDREDGDG